MLMKKFFAEFKKFISKGNVMDMAVGIVIGGAFTAIINSFVADILNPLISLVLGKTDFSDLKIILKAGIEATETTEAIPEVAITYGNLLQAVINFILIALVLFCFIKAVNKIKEKAEAAEKAKAAAEAAAKAEAEAKAAAEAAAEAERLAALPSKEEVLLSEIRDLLKEKK